MRKNLLPLLLALLLCLGGCGGKTATSKAPDSGSSGDSGGSQTADQSQSAETEAPMFDGLEQKNYNGTAFRMLTRTTEDYQFFSEGFNGDTVNDKVYERNMAVEGAFGVVISTIPTAGAWGESAFMDKLRGSVLAGDGAFELVDGYAAVIGGAFGDHLLYNLRDIPNLRLTSPWWSQLAYEELTVNGRLYAIPGDIAVNLWQSMFAMLFNKNLLGQYGFASPYDDVKAGNWTFDKYLELNKGVGSDVNGDGKMNVDDRFGTLYYDDLAVDNFRNAFNIKYTTKAADGTIELSIDTDLTRSVYEKLYAMTYSNPDIYFITGGADTAEPKATAAFNDDRSLWFPTILKTAETLRSMDSDFGIIPYPKYSESQEGYYTTSRDGRSMFCIPADVTDVDFAGLITEALCVASNRTVIPAYYDIVLKGKAARDDESADMLDIIRDGVRFDFVSEYSVQTERAGFIIRDCIYNKKDFTTEYAKNESKFKTSFEKFITAYYD